MATWKDDFIQVYTGIKFYPLNPRSEDVDIADIAHSLSLKCRYGGHCSKFYSVAEHSVYVSQYVSQENALWGLLHDAGEAYLADIPRPIKGSLTGFKELEANVMKAVCAKYNLVETEPADIKRVDTAILADEYEELMKKTVKWYLPENPLGVQIHGYLPEVAEAMFLMRFNELYAA